MGIKQQVIMRFLGEKGLQLQERMLLALVKILLQVDLTQQLLDLKQMQVIMAL